MGGTLVDLSGFVLTRACRPVARVVVDLWQADDRGEYDNRSFRLRGHQRTDAAGRYQFRTIVPANYDFRTRHFHVKVAAPGRPVLITQLYFPDEPEESARPHVPSCAADARCAGRADARALRFRAGYGLSAAPLASSLRLG